MFTDSPYIPIFRSNERLFMPIKNTYFLLLDKIKQPLTDFINEFEERTIHEWICHFMRKTMVQIPSP